MFLASLGSAMILMQAPGSVETSSRAPCSGTVEARDVNEPTEQEKVWLRTLLEKRLEGDIEVRAAYKIRSFHPADIANYRSVMAGIKDPVEYFAKLREFEADAAETSDEADRLKFAYSMNAYDAETWGLLEWITEQFGFPSQERIGSEKDYGRLFLQHPPSRSRQKRLECLFKGEVLEGRLDAQAFAEMVDKMNLAHGEPVTYGAMATMINGELAPYPVGDLASVNAARQEIGLPPREN